MVANPGPFEVEINVSYEKVEGAIFDGLNSRRDLRRALKRYVDDIHTYWLLAWDTSSLGKQEGPGARPHSYATGEYRNSIKKKDFTIRQKLFIKSMARKGIPFGMVYTDDDKAHWIEYGTDPDNPKSESPFGPDTPTPEFRPMHRAMDMMRARGFR